MNSLITPFLAMLVAAQAPPARLTKEQIIVGLTQRRSELDRFRVTYLYRAVDQKNNLIEEKRMRFARDGSKRFSDVEILKGGRPPSRLRATFDGSVSKQLRLGYGAISPTKTVVTDGYDNICMSLHIPFSDDTYAAERRPGQTWYLPGGVDQDRYIVLPEQQQVGGRWAHVLWVKDPEKLFNAYWVDPDLDFALLKSEVRTKDYVSQRFIYEGHEPAGDRVMPRRIVMEDEPSSRTGVRWRSTTTIEDVFVGELPNETFDLIFPPGTLVTNEVTGRAYQIPGPAGVEFDKLSEQAKREVVQFQRRMQGRPTTPGRGWPTWTIVAIVLGIALAVAVAARRFLRR